MIGRVRNILRRNKPAGAKSFVKLFWIDDEDDVDVKNSLASINLSIVERHLPCRHCGADAGVVTEDEEGRLGVLFQHKPGCTKEIAWKA